MAAAALPDKFGHERVDLRDYDHSVCRRYWLLFAASGCLMNAVSIWARAQLRGVGIDLMSSDYLIVVAALILAVWRNRRLHTLGLAGFIALHAGVCGATL
jgi:hypothetical protein